MTIVHSMLVIHLRARQQEVRETEHVESFFFERKNDQEVINFFLEKNRLFYLFINASIGIRRASRSHSCSFSLEVSDPLG